ncbi:hypothetical protein T4B_13802 [Trichinella pseudospiralis]|uniref:Uncharacterized protein n=1 Tax=Trichinella pseudospiralis TaxID=6337 RepID=A0A0V1EEQ5_TRIPS|nr:hypothetical protein T4A_2206 [Trichinella pseudospiralis]KRZ33253.1 hypothetical protein T4B_13802 [Trichinella pseudospiralis]KRZ37051.1 hypothetical protein T4C_13376 [Trichinella pseudospiralis]
MRQIKQRIGELKFSTMLLIEKRKWLQNINNKLTVKPTKLMENLQYSFSADSDGKSSYYKLTFSILKYCLLNKPIMKLPQKRY